MSCRRVKAPRAQPRGTFAAGSSQTVTATANGGYAFVNWTENGNVVSTSASYTFALNGNRTLVAKFLNLRLQADLLKKTRGHYPAVLKALEVVTRGATTSISDSLKRESEALVQLVQTETCKNLIRVFFLQERARKLSGVTAATASPLAGSIQADQRAPSQPEVVAPVKQLAVIGAGVMGAGIAQWASARELKVILRDLNPELVAKGMASEADVQRVQQTLHEEGETAEDSWHQRLKQGRAKLARGDGCAYRISLPRSHRERWM